MIGDIHLFNECKTSGLLRILNDCHSIVVSRNAGAIVQNFEQATSCALAQQVNATNGQVQVYVIHPFFKEAAAGKIPLSLSRETHTHTGTNK